MEALLLRYLKLADVDSLEGYVYCGNSMVFPGYSYFIKTEDVSFINETTKCFNSDLFQNNNSKWILSLLDCLSIQDFEEKLFCGFSDLRDVLSRMEIVRSISVSDSPDWFKKPLILENKTNKVKDIEGELAELTADEIITLAEYDSTIYYLKTIDHQAIVSVLASFLQILADVNQSTTTTTYFEEVTDVLFQNLIISLQMTKNIAPEKARKFLTYVLKHYIAGMERGGLA